MTGGPPLGQVAARLRAATLAAWAQNPARFREDANAEEDHGAGWYRDRVVVELAQNAADAALQDDAVRHTAGHAAPAGSLLLRLSTRERTLTAANTGAPLDADGLASLASLRASAKRDRVATGRFGVGFAAVRSVADEIGVVTRAGASEPAAVHFSVARIAAALLAVPGLVGEAERRAGVLPALRLPFEGPGPADPALLAHGWDTAVVLRLRDADAVATVRAQLDALDDALLLALPGLATVRVEVDEDARVLTDVTERWVVVTTTGEHDPEALAGRPVEERARAAWRLTWAVPRRTGVAVPATVHAPTPTDDPCGVPALLLGTFPLDPGRRRVTPGPVTDALVAAAGRAWPELLVAVRRARAGGAHAPDPLDLVPLGLPAGPLDAALRAAVLDASAGAPVLATPGGWATPREAMALAAPWDATPAPRVLGRWFTALVDASPARRDVLRALGVTTVGLGELVEQLPAAEPTALREVYALLALGDADELGAAPVPLADGRVVHGARGTVLVDAAVTDGAIDETLDPDVLGALVGWGLRVVHPAAAHEALERLGAQRVDAAALARHPVLRERVLDGDERAARVLLALVAAAPDGEPGPSWWSEALVPDEDGEPTPARDLVLPGSPAAAWLDPDAVAPVDAELAARHPVALARVGVRAGIVVERVDDLVADAIEDWSEYVEDTGVADDGTLWGVADLDAVRDWPAYLAALARHPEATTPVRTAAGDLAPTYAVWRLRDEPALGTGRPFALPGVDRSAGVLAHLEPADPDLAALPAELLRALGGVGRAEDLDDEDWAVLLDELEEGAEVPLGLAVDCWRALAARARDPRGLGELAEVAVLPGWDGERARACAVEDMVTADPAWRRLAARPGRPVLPVPFGADLADLGLDDAADLYPGRVAPGGRPEPVPPAARTLVPGVPATVVRHEELEVDGHPLDWWVQDGVVHATDAGLAEGLAAVAGWAHRHRLAAVLADPAAHDAALLDAVDDPA